MRFLIIISAICISVFGYAQEGISNINQNQYDALEYRLVVLLEEEEVLLLQAYLISLIYFILGLQEVVFGKLQMEDVIGRIFLMAILEVV